MGAGVEKLSPSPHIQGETDTLWRAGASLTRSCGSNMPPAFEPLACSRQEKSTAEAPRPPAGDGPLHTPSYPVSGRSQQRAPGENTELYRTTIFFEFETG